MKPTFLEIRTTHARVAELHEAARQWNLRVRGSGGHFVVTGPMSVLWRNPYQRQLHVEVVRLNDVVMLRGKFEYPVLAKLLITFLLTVWAAVFVGFLASPPVPWNATNEERALTTVIVLVLMFAFAGALVLKLVIGRVWGSSSERRLTEWLLSLAADPKAKH